jgi:hypothetical protein
VHSWFVRDPWLEPLTAEARFREALARAERRSNEAAQMFHDAHGERLLSMSR